MITSSREFGNFTPVIRYCEQTGVQLHENVIESAARSDAFERIDEGTWSQTSTHLYTPTASHAAVAAAAEIHRKNGAHKRGGRLADGPITPLSGVDTTTRQVIELVNSERRVEGAKLLAGSVAVFERSDTYRIDTCGWADARFSQVFTTFSAHSYSALSEQVQDTMFGFQLVIRNEQPLFLRKADIASALSFVPLAVRGRLYPAGTIYKLESQGSASDAGSLCRESLPYPSQRSIGKLDVASIGRVAAMRLSIFASPPGIERVLPACELSMVEPEVELLARTATIEQLRQQATVIAAMIPSRGLETSGLAPAQTY